MVMFAGAGASAREAVGLEAEEEGSGTQGAFVARTGPGEVGAVKVTGFDGMVGMEGAAVEEEIDERVLVLLGGGSGVADG